MGGDVEFFAPWVIGRVYAGRDVAFKLVSWDLCKIATSHCHLRTCFLRIDKNAADLDDVWIVGT